MLLASQLDIKLEGGLCYCTGTAFSGRKFLVRIGETLLLDPRNLKFCSIHIDFNKCLVLSRYRYGFSRFRALGANSIYRLRSPLYIVTVTVTSTYISIYTGIEISIIKHSNWVIARCKVIMSSFSSITFLGNKNFSSKK